MKKFVCAGLAIMLAMFASGCTVAAPNAGHEMVWVEKPIFVGHGGVNPTPVTVGRSYGWLTSDAIDVNMYPQRVDEEFDDMMTKSGVPVNFHVVITFQITDPVMMVSKYGVDVDDKGNWGFWTRVLDQPFRTAVRDAVKQREMQDMAISQIASDDVRNEVSTAALKIVKDSGIPIVITELNVGRINPPDAVKTARIATAEQEQRAITEQQTKLAEDQRKAAETSRAEADKAYLAAMGLSPEQYIQLEQIRMQRDVCEHSNCTFFIGHGGPSPVYDVGKK